ncbi:hypothetical protein ACJW30_05G202300 [Castanea mollissima]
MLLAVFNSWVFLETRRLTTSFPEHVRKFWIDWELRVLVLVSLTLQLSLLHFGSRRRYSVKTWLRVFLWLSYLVADSVATTALGVISNNQRNCNDSQLHNELRAFWAPFMLLHLGGQDTITAYAVQDNELWLRHLLDLVVQSGVALYIFFLSWKVSSLSFLTIPVFLAGLIKYAERTWALNSANYDSMAAFLERRRQRIGRGNDEDVRLVAEDLAFKIPYDIGIDDEAISRAKLNHPFMLFEIFRCLFQNRKVKDSILLRDGLSYFRDSESAWKTIEDELGYAYDVYYTKAPLFFTAWGFLFRFFSFTSALFAFVLLLTKERHKHPQIDLIITYILLVGAILIETYAVILLSASDWPLRSYGNRFLGNCFKTLFTPVRNGCAKLTSKQRWSNSMGQLNLLGLCLQDKSLQDDHGTPKNLRERVSYRMLLLYTTHKPVSDEFKKLVFNTLRSPNRNGFHDEYITNGAASARVETYQRIIIWHIATDLCFYTDSDRKKPNLNREVSKGVSDYIMYILEMCPLELPKEDAKFSFEQTYCDLVKLVKKNFPRENLSRLSKDQVCRSLISGFKDSGTNLRWRLWEEDLLPFAVQVAYKLNQNDGKWELLSKFWVENLAHVATLCQGHDHAQLLRKGGEFLTHVWILKEHFNHIKSSQEP